MGFSIAPYVALLVFVCALSSGLAIHAWRQRQIAGALGLSVLMTLVAGWSIGYIFEFVSADLTSKVIWSRIQYLPIAAIPPAWLLFALQYGQYHRWLSGRLVAALAVVPTLTVLIQFTGDRYGLIWRHVDLDANGALPILNVTYGPWFWLHSAYSYLLLLVGAILMVREIRRTNYLFRWRSAVLLGAVLLPWLGNAAYLARLSILDLTPFAFALSGLLLSWSIVGFRLFKLTPVAREVVLESMRDGVLVLDKEGRIVDLNPSAAQIFGVTPSRVVGQPATRLPGVSDAQALADALQVEAACELTVGEGAAQRILELRSSPVADHAGQVSGRVVILRDITEVRRSAQERQQLVALIEHSDDLIGMADLEGRMLYLNFGGLQLVGLESQRDALSRSMYDFIFPDDLPLFRDTIVPHVLQVGHWRGDVRYRHFQNGSAIPVYISVFLVREMHTGKPLAFATVSRDITERKQIEARLQQQTHYLRVLNAMGQAAIEIDDPDALLQILSQQLGELLGADAAWIALEHAMQQAPIGVNPKGYASDMLLNGPVGNADDQADNVRVIENLRERMQCEGMPDPQCDYASALGIPLFNGSERIGRAVVAFRQPQRFTPETSQLAAQAGRQIALALSRAKLHEEVAHQNRRLEAMIGAIRDGVALIGINLQILVLNQAILNLLGLSGAPKDWVGRPLQAAIKEIASAAPEVAAVVEQELRRVLGGDRTPNSGEFEIGSRILLWQSLPVRAGATASGRLIILRDVTDERLLERMRNDLIHTMVHDLRNPLTAIYGALGILRMFPDMSSEAKEIIQVALNGSQKMLKLVNAILEIKRLENRKLPLHRVPLSLTDLIADTVMQFEALAGAKQQRIAYDRSVSLPNVYADPDIVRRVLENLIGNAVKFTPEQGSIRITASWREDQPDYVLVSVQDSGPGIPEALQERLFEQFVTGEHPESGSGLGLAFCRLAVEAHGGTIGVSSAPGQGATFTFTLPVAVEQCAARAVAPEGQD